MTMIAVDTETHLIKTGAMAPRLVCVQMNPEGEHEGPVLVARADGWMQDAIEALLTGDETLVFHNAPFDLTVLAAECPHLLSAIFSKLERGQVLDTQVREKLLNLCDTGDLEYVDLPDGSTSKLSYSLSALEFKYLGIDRSDQKEGPDIWRLNYHSLEPTPSDQWPPDARTYALEDVSNTLAVCAAQDRRADTLKQLKGVDPFATELFRNCANFAFQLITCWGMAVDPEAKAQVEAMLEEELKPEKMQHLIEAKILQPGSPPRPYANGATDKDGNSKMTKGSKDKISRKVLQAYCFDVAQRNPEVKLRYNIPSPTARMEAESRGRELMSRRMPVNELVKKTKELARQVHRPCPDIPPGFESGVVVPANDSEDPLQEVRQFYCKAFGTLKCDGEFFADYSHIDPVFAEYKHRQDLQKLVTTEIPRMNDPETGATSPIVHPQFDILKSTGRTSSFASQLVASLNCQNVDPRARSCFVPRPGYLFGSSDYNQMELGTLAQKCIDLFGTSQLADLINAGIDVHAYLGAQMARSFDDEFRRMTNNDVSPMAIYRKFAALKDSDEEEAKAFFKQYRTFAKPTDLGYPGGLGAETFVQYAKATYGVIITREQAEGFKEVWLETFPEMRQYFDYINKQCVDPFNGPIIKEIVDEDGQVHQKESSLYHYDTRYGLYRAGCDYCACANGMGLQSPSAEGAISACFSVVRATMDPEMESVLYDDQFGARVRVVAFIHDELLYEVRDDPEIVPVAVDTIEQLMVHSMQNVTPDVASRVESALMRRWDKAAEPVFDGQGNLTVWEPEN